MPPARYLVLAKKSLAASLAAIEIYNKPSFSYREETFAILMINAWELLLKARIIQKTGGKWQSVYVLESRRNKDGTKSARKTFQRNRAGQPMTVGLDRAANIVSGYGNNGIDQPCIANLRLLQSIRDSAIHLYNVEADLAFRIYRIGSAALRNFVTAYEDWFGSDLDRYNLYLLPIAFRPPSDVVVSPRAVRQPEVAMRLMKEMAEAENQNPATSSSRFDVAIQVELNYRRTTDSHGIPVRKDSRDPSSIQVTWTEEQVRTRYPWDYHELTSRIASRYIDFVRNKRYYGIKKCLEKDDSLCHVRYLDPEKKSGGNKKFYSTSILSHFDQHYTRRQ